MTAEEWALVDAHNNPPNPMGETRGPKMSTPVHTQAALMTVTLDLGQVAAIVAIFSGVAGALYWVIAKGVVGPIVATIVAKEREHIEIVMGSLVQADEFNLYREWDQQEHEQIRDELLRFERRIMTKFEGAKD
jgi:hypothetical protein